MLLLQTPSENSHLPLSRSRAAAALWKDRLSLWRNGGGKTETSFSVLTDRQRISARWTIGRQHILRRRKPKLWQLSWKSSIARDVTAPSLAIIFLTTLATSVSQSGTPPIAI